MLAYSATAQLSYVLLSLSAGTTQAYIASAFYLISYLLMSLLAFSFLAILSNNKINCDNIRDLSNLNDQYPILALILLIVLFSLAGLPPFLGFIAKIFIFEALIKQHMIWQTCLALLLSVISVYYYINVIKVMYFEQNNNKISSQTIKLLGNGKLVINKSLLTIIIFFSIILILLGLMPNFLFDICTGIIT